MPIAVTRSVGGSEEIGRAAYDGTFPRVGDALTLYVGRRLAFTPVRWAIGAGFPAAAAIAAEALLAALVFACFWHGYYWLGLLLSVAVMLASVTALMLSRLTHATPATSRLRSAVELLYPLLWWWGWEHGLAAYGRPFEPIYATMVLWVVVGGTIAIQVVEAIAMHRANGMELHAWRPIDSRVRLLSASRNSNLAILALALLFRRPDSGFVLVAWSTLISLIFHSVRLAQLTEQQSRRLQIKSWLDR